jgi:TolA-binding protein
VLRFRKWIWIAVVGAVAGLLGRSGRAGESLTPPAPLAPEPAVVSAGTLAEGRAAAQWALDLGIYGMAADLYRQLLAAPGADRSGLTLKLATALLGSGDAAAAEKVLLELPEPHGAAWHLRAGLAAMQLKKREAAQAGWDATKPDELPPGDLPWYWFLAGALYDTSGRDDAESKANEYYSRAEAAPELNDLARARIQLAAEEVRLRREKPLTPDQLRAALATYEANRGTATGYESAKNYALGLVALGQGGDAMVFLQKVLPVVPIQDSYWWAYFRLMAGVIGDRGRSIAGRKALTELLAIGHDPRRQRQALQLLWEASKEPRDEIARQQLRAELDRLIALKPNHAILDSLLLYRAQISMLEKRDDEAMAHATRVIEEFPGSTLRADAYGVLTRLAWKRGFYRSAAGYAGKAHDELASASDPAAVAARAELGLVRAEAWFRGGDFRSAADAYAAVLRERPPHVSAGRLIHQRVYSEIKAGSPEAAAKVLDELRSDPEFDLVNQWEAEWSLARELEVRGKVAQAFDRVNRLLAPGGQPGLPADLRARLQWLQARLALEANQPEQAVKLVDALVSALGGVEARLADEIASTALLQKAQAEFALWRAAGDVGAKTRLEAAGLATLQQVRDRFGNSDAAAKSHLIESEHFEEMENITEAQRKLTPLTENPAFKDKPLIPWAYFHLALLSEKLGQEKDLTDAYKYIEKLVSEPAAKGQNDLVFAARLKQGQILMKMNQYAQAQQVFLEIKDKPAPPEYSIMALLELAKCYHAQASVDPTKADSARGLFEDLHDHAGASPDVQVEAGYNLGLLHVLRGDPDDAYKVWWSDVVMRFLKPGSNVGPGQEYWLARTLLDLGDLLEKQKKLEDAKAMYRLILTKNLGVGQGLAKAALEKLGVPVATP